MSRKLGAFLAFLAFTTVLSDMLARLVLAPNLS